MANKYYSMNEVPLGAKMVVKKSGEEVTLIEIHHFPTSFKTENKEGNINSYLTYEVDIEDWPPKE